MDAEVVEAVLEGAAHQKLHAEIIDLLLRAGVVVGVEDLVLFAEDLAGDAAERLVIDLVGGVLRLDEHVALEGVQEEVLEDLLGVVLADVHDTLLILGAAGAGRPFMRQSGGAAAL